MKEITRLSAEEKKLVCKERFEEGKSTKELAKEYGVCQSTIIRISNRYRESGINGLERNRVKRGGESLQEKIKRLETENQMLRDMHRVFSALSKKK